MQVTICIVQHKNHEQVQRVLNEVSLVDFKHYEVIVIDNNVTDYTPEFNIPQTIKQFRLYRNMNIGQLSGATNQAVLMAEGELFVYLCGNHTHINSSDWLKYMVDCLGDRAMGGTVSPYAVLGRSGMHVQGGCFIAQTKVLKEIRYDEVLYPFSFMDVDMSEQVLKRGYELVDMPLMKSVMGDLPFKNKYKIYHSHT